MCNHILDGIRFSVNCEIFSFLDNENDENNSTSLVFKVLGYPYKTDIAYRIINDTHYQWCGPMMLIAKYFALWKNARSIYHIAFYLINFHFYLN